MFFYSMPLYVLYSIRTTLKIISSDFQQFLSFCLIIFSMIQPYNKVQWLFTLYRDENSDLMSNDEQYKTQISFFSF